MADEPGGFTPEDAAWLNATTAAAIAVHNATVVGDADGQVRRWIDGRVPMAGLSTVRAADGQPAAAVLSFTDGGSLRLVAADPHGPIGLALTVRAAHAAGSRVWLDHLTLRPAGDGVDVGLVAGGSPAHVVASAVWVHPPA